MSPTISLAVAALRAGQVVAFPTETVYGLGADATNPLAVRQVFALKGRPADHPLIVHLPAATHLDAWAQPTPLARRLAAHFWPGPLTLILPRTPLVPDEVTGGQDTVGVRVPDHPLALELLRAFGGGLAAPSANRFGRISPTTAAHVHAEFADSHPAPLILDGGPCQIGVESTIVDLSGARPALLRPGGAPVEEIEAILGQPLARPSTTASETPRAPGTLAAHYAPRTALRLSTTPEAEAARLRSEGRTVAVLRAPASMADYARLLYAELRRLDALAVEILVAEPAPAAGGGLALAINDRLQRAAVGSGDGEG